MKGCRVVVTGVGVISSLGCTAESTWQQVLQGKSGIKPITEFDTSAYAVKFAGTVTDFSAESFGLQPKDARKMDPFMQYGYAAGVAAVQDAGIENVSDKSRVGVLIGSGIGGLETIESNNQALLEGGPRKVSPFFVPGSIINLASGHVSIRFGFTGPNLAVATACTTGTHAIGLAARTIAYGDADIMVCGGAEKASSPLGIAGFSALKALSTRNDAPEKASRPWDKDRDGFVLGDGAAVIVLESYESAMQRGATIYAELVGFGMSGDAYHMVQPAEGGTGFISCMTNAIKDAGIAPSDIDYINAHGTSTPLGDVNECAAIKEVFKEHAYKLKVSSTKSMTGHLLGGAGAIEAVFSILALRDQIAPPTINLDNPSEGCDLDFVPNKAQECEINYVLSNSFGFGGTNGSLIFKKV